MRLRKTLTKNGLDAGAETIAAHLATGGVDPVPAASTIWRILSRRGFVTPQPQKRPRSSWRSFCADQPNERWQADITHWRRPAARWNGSTKRIAEHGARAVIAEGGDLALERQAIAF